ncbi:MAG: T9SS type A sorting domain-containing protein [Bacteroidetes bacterium]|nr:T9SS type A sorting domain-containing protein [Bacteroidota bacterium]
MKKKLLFIAVVFISNLNAQTWQQLEKIVASDRKSNQQFGNAVDIDGPYAIVGTWLEDRDGNGQNTMQMAGAAYIFEGDGKTGYTQKVKILPNDRDTVAEFGYDVAISGNYAIVGCPANDFDANGSNYVDWAGAAYIFEKQSSGSWIQVQKLVASDRLAGSTNGGSFGFSVDIDSNVAVIGTYNQDVIVGSTHHVAAGEVYVFERNSSGVWNETQKLIASDFNATDYFGTSVAIHKNRIIVGSHQNYTNATGGNFSFFTGAAYIFEKQTSGTWTEMQKIVANDRRSMAYFGWSVGICNDFAIIGAYGDSADASGLNNIHNAGSAYIFEYNTSNTWVQTQKIVSSYRDNDGRFGWAVDVSDSTAIIGAFQEGDTSSINQLTQAGSTHIYKRNSSGNWNLLNKALSSDLASGDYYGYDVAIKNDRAIIGAVYEDENVLGTGSLFNSGSAYIFRATSGSSSLSVSEKNKNTFALYPNPTADFVTIVLENNLEKVQLEIVDATGKLLFENSFDNSAPKTLNLSNLTNGLYLVRVKTSIGVSTERIVINR